MLAGGVHVALFRPLHRWWNWLQPGQLRRLHHKLCVVDAEVAFVGGINLIDDRFDLNHGWSELPRLDFAVRVRGPLAPAVQRTARAMWTRASLGQAWREEVLALAGSAEPLARAKRLLDGCVRSGPVPEAADADLRPVRAAFLVRDNVRQRRSIERSYVEAIRQARHRIDIASAYFYPDRSILQCAARGHAARRARAPAAAGALGLPHGRTRRVRAVRRVARATACRSTSTRPHSCMPRSRWSTTTGRPSAVPTSTRCRCC